jgi:hypothetical protein
VALSCESPRLGVTQHRALWSPDVPRTGQAGTRSKNVVADHQCRARARSAWRILLSTMRIRSFVTLLAACSGGSVVTALILARFYISHLPPPDTASGSWSEKLWGFVTSVRLRELVPAVMLAKTGSSLGLALRAGSPSCPFDGFTFPTASPLRSYDALWCRTL